MNFLSYTPEQMNEIVEFIAQNYDLQGVSGLPQGGKEYAAESAAQQ